MAKSLVIVESPAKSKTIGKYLGKQYVVKASLGHVKDLPKKNLSVDVDGDFTPHYEIIEGKKKLIQELKQAAKDVDAVYLAADPDREGEAICYHLAEELAPKKGAEKPQIFRVMFNEITANAVKKAFEQPMAVNTNLVDAQQARRVLDRLVGYKISPLLWDKVRRGLSAGRVQTVALRLIVDREREIRAFQKQEYWTIDAVLGAQKGQLRTRLAKRDGEAPEISAEAAAQAVVAALDNVDFTVASVATREKKRNPIPPFITSTLQQESSRKLRFSVKRTMGLAQRLYEGVELGSEGAVGLITYMRTDSVRVSNDALAEVREFIPKRFGEAYLPAAPNVYKGKKDAQDAHEAIRPTSVLNTPEQVEKFLSEDEFKLYRLVWSRFVASQMAPAVGDQTTIEVKAKGKDNAEYLFRATGTVPKFDGFLAVYEEGKDQKDDEDDESKRKLPAVTQGETLKCKAIEPEQHFTEPPPRFNEATLVKELEADGVGRPSTYASILSTIQDRGYVKKEGGKFSPTELGFVVTDLLVKNFDDIFDVKYTARMEGELDDIEEGKIDWRAAMSEFYDKFKVDLVRAESTMEDIKRSEKPTDLVCDKCSRPMVLRWGKHGWFVACSGYPECTSTREPSPDMIEGEAGAGIEFTEQDETEYCENCGREMVLKKGRFGQFFACSGYPECKTTKPLGGEQKKADVPLEENCPQCNSKLMLRYGRFGEFTSCSNYPTCKYIKQKTIGVKCPNCSEGEVVERRSKRGKTFFGCNRYPDCDFVAWGKPIAEKCPSCESPYLVEKYLKSGAWAQCPNKECKFKRELEPAPAAAAAEESPATSAVSG